MPDAGLPTYHTELVARGGEAHAVLDRLAEGAPLVTVTGPGGVGKTRLAAAVAAAAGSAFPDGVRFVALESARDERALLLAIARALPAGLGASDDLLREVRLFLADRRMLLVLDNFEQLVGHAEVISRLLEGAPGLALLVTSREALNLREEWRMPLTGLPPPTAAGTDLAESPAAQLFIARARQVRPAFDPAREADAIRRICWTLDGLPLGLELAASWAGTLSCDEIATALEADLDSLVARTRNVPARHRQLRAVFDHSWQALSDDEQAAFRALSVMAGPFAAGAARAALGIELDLLASLVDKSLVHRLPDGRFELSSVLRQYAAEALASSGDAGAVRERHGVHYLRFLSAHAGAPEGGDEAAAIDALELELANVLAAWSWGVETDRLREWPAAPFALHRFYQFRSRYLEAAALIADTLERTPADASAAALTLALRVVAGWLAIRQGRLERAREHLTVARDLQAQRELTPYRATEFGTDPMLPLGVLALTEGRYADAAALGEAAHSAAQDAGDGANAMLALHITASAALATGDLGRAAECAEAGAVLAERLGQHWMRAYHLDLLGDIALEQRNDVLARARYAESYDIRERYHDREGMALALTGLGEVARRAGDLPEAERQLRSSLALYHDLGDRGGLARTLSGLGRVAAERGDRQTAEERFRRALETALGVGSARLTAEVLGPVGAALIAPADPPAAVELFAFLEGHAASPAPLRRWAERQREATAHGMPARRAEAAARRGRQRTFTEIAEAVRLALLHGRAPPAPDASGLLTRREMEVLELMAHGLSNPAIGRELGVGAGTVKWHAAQIFGKLDVRSRTAAARRGRELGLLP